jgi:hypothetical protein
LEHRHRLGVGDAVETGRDGRVVAEDLALDHLLHGGVPDHRARIGREGRERVADRLVVRVARERPDGRDLQVVELLRRRERDPDQRFARDRLRQHRQRIDQPLREQGGADDDPLEPLEDAPGQPLAVVGKVARPPVENLGPAPFEAGECALDRVAEHRRRQGRERGVQLGEPVPEDVRLELESSGGSAALRHERIDEQRRCEEDGGEERQSSAHSPLIVECGSARSRARGPPKDRS